MALEVLSLKCLPKQQEHINAGNVGRPQMKGVWEIQESRDVETLVKTGRGWTVQTAARNRIFATILK